MYDFDKLFSDFIKAKGHVHEDDLGDVYNEWLITYNKDLNATPNDILNQMSDCRLIEELKEECLCGSPSLTVMETIEKRAPVQSLISLLNSKDENAVYCAAEILTNLNKAPLEKFAQMLPYVEDRELFELLVSALKDNPDLVKETLFEIAESAAIDLKTVVAEILIEGSKDERTFNLLKELFAYGDNLPLYADYCARYGDERAAAMLYRALDTAKYADYIEIRNAIEALGGIVDDDKDFSSDPEYIMIKEKNHGK